MFVLPEILVCNLIMFYAYTTKKHANSSLFNEDNLKMAQDIKESRCGENRQPSFEEEISELTQEKILFADNMYAHIPFGIEIYDTEGMLHYINDHALKMYGVDDRNTVIGKINLFKSPYMDEKLKARILSGEDILLEFEYDFDRINKDSYFESSNKNSMIYNVNIIAIRNKEKRLIGHMLLSNDMTVVKAAEFRTEESKKNLELAMDAADMSSWFYDVHKKMFGSLYGNPIGNQPMSLDDLLCILHPQDHCKLMEMFSKLVNKEIQYGNLTVRYYNAKEGRYRHYESRMRLSEEHRGKKLIVGTVMDVTEKMRLAKETQDLMAKRELAMKVSDIVHWDFDVNSRQFTSHNDPINDYAKDKPVTIAGFLKFVHPEDTPAMNDAIQEMISGHDSNFSIPCRVKTKHDESWQHCQIIGVPFERDEQGRIVRFTGFRQNISKLHQLSEEVRERNYKMELTLKTIGMSYWDFDVESKTFKAFNDPVNDYDSGIRITPGEYIAVSHPDDRDTVSRHFDHMLQGTDKEFSFKYRSRTKWDQEWQTYVMTGIQSERDKKGKVIRYTGIQFNNTEWEKVTQELKQLKEKAELSDRLKSAFLANMSHEIRTPLNAIIGFSELMVTCEDPAEKKEYAEIIQSNNELLLRLINDILDLSKIEAGILDRKREEFDLAAVCKELYTMIQPRITNPRVEFRMAPGPECRICLDRNRLKQVWMNFLTNAVKCTQAGHITLGYSVDGEGICIWVEDTGVGIPPELQDKVFGRFQKLNEFAQGTGLGLAISRAIIEAAGGKIGFTSAPGAGSTFWARIPV